MSYPLYYGQQIAIQAYSYGAGWLGVTSGLPAECGYNDLMSVPDIFTAYLGTTLYSQGEPFTILNSAGQMPAAQTAVNYNDVITLQQTSTGKFWTIVPKCHDNTGIALGIPSATTATYTLVPQNSANAKQAMTAAVAGVAPSSTANSFYLQSVQQPNSYVSSDPNGNGVLLNSSQKTYFQFFLVTAPPSPPSGCTSTSCASGYSCVNNACVKNAITCTANSNTCPSGYGCFAGVCQPPCVQTSNCPTGSLCTNGFCIPPQCTVNSQCQANYVCQGNTCIPISACTSNSTCNQGWTCQNNICVPPIPQCSGSQKCSFGKSCTNGVCEWNFIIPSIVGGAFILIVFVLIILSRIKK
jgi:hypothetical protein